MVRGVAECLVSGFGFQMCDPGIKSICLVIACYYICALLFSSVKMELIVKFIVVAKIKQDGMSKVLCCVPSLTPVLRVVN